MDKSKITNVLIFKDGFYWLATTPVLTRPDIKSLGTISEEMEGWYHIIEKVDFDYYGIDRNGFEFASDAYAYLAFLKPDKQPTSHTMTIDTGAV